MGHAAMVREWVIARMLFAAAMVAFGVQCLIFSNFVSGLEPIRAAVIPPTPWGPINGVFLILCGVSLLIDRSARIGALLLAALLLLSAVVLYGPPMLTQPKTAADDLFHVLAIGSAALVLASEVGPRGGWLDGAGVAARLCFGVCTIGHGVMHFVFFKFTADFIPAWIPAHDVFAAATGVAQIAAGLAILSGIQGRLAAALCGLMYGSWALVVHIPRALAAQGPTVRPEWTNIVIATALSASALVVAGAIGRARLRGAA